jgi:hypothetical protein
MRNYLLPIAIAIGAASCSPPELCKTQTNLTCQRFFDCADAQTIILFTPKFGATRAECEVKLAASANCDTKTNDNSLCQDNPFNATEKPTFDLGKAQACIDEQKKLSCASYLALVASSVPTGKADTTSVPSCALECK